MNKQSGYTLVELLVGVLSIAVLALGGFIAYTILRLAWALIGALGG